MSLLIDLPKFCFGALTCRLQSARGRPAARLSAAVDPKGTQHVALEADTAVHMPPQGAKPAVSLARFPAGVHVRASDGEHAVSLGDGSFIGFPTPCGQGRGCGNPTCTMSCIRRISQSELLHWAGSRFEANGGELRAGEEEGSAALDEAALVEAALRALHVLGRDGSLLFADQPKLLVKWCRSTVATLEVEGGADSTHVGWEPWDPAARAQAAQDLSWLKERSTPIRGDMTGVSLCPIAAAVPRRPFGVDGEMALCV